MKYAIFTLFICLSLHLFAKVDPPIPQVEIETKFVEVEHEDLEELGFEWGIGPTFGHYTNTDDPNQSNVVGLNTFVGVDYYFHPVVSVYGHIDINQFGNGTKLDDGYNNIKFTTVGIDGGIKLHIKPHVVADAFILVGLEAGGIVGGVTKYKQNGEKDKVHFGLNEEENKAFAGVNGGVGITIRTDVVDMTISAIVTGGLTMLEKNPPENTPRSVPFFAQIPFSIRFFGKHEQKKRNHVIFLVTPTIVEDDEP